MINSVDKKKAFLHFSNKILKASSILLFFSIPIYSYSQMDDEGLMEVWLIKQHKITYYETNGWRKSLIFKKKWKEEYVIDNRFQAIHNKYHSNLKKPSSTQYFIYENDTVRFRVGSYNGSFFEFVKFSYNEKAKDSAQISRIEGLYGKINDTINLRQKLSDKNLKLYRRGWYSTIITDYFKLSDRLKHTKKFNRYGSYYKIIFNEDSSGMLLTKQEETLPFTDTAYFTSRGDVYKGSHYHYEVKIQDDTFAGYNEIPRSYTQWVYDKEKRTLTSHYYAQQKNKSYKFKGTAITSLYNTGLIKSDAYYNSRGKLLTFKETIIRFNE